MEAPGNTGAPRWAVALLAAIGVFYAVVGARLSTLPLPQLASVSDERAAVLAQIPYSDGFDFPVGKGEGTNYYVALSVGQPRRPKGLPHRGEDWNGNRGWNSDFGDPVAATANGVVIFSGDGGRGWGQCIILGHRLPGKFRDRQIDSFYGHLHERLVEEGQIVRRGELIGRIGNADGRYFAHLHFEIRRRPWLGMQYGYGPAWDWWLRPSEFVRAHRPSAKLQAGPGTRPR
ncbi:MAG: M23 family metallopeptidase [Verrucomicrobiae bacterium]|nr:M23 family metallopeptidase [Verrucomicrobiae bacterium]